MSAVSMKTVCLFGHHAPAYFKETNTQSELIERCAVDLWNAGFGVLSPHLNAPRAEGLFIPEWIRLAFDGGAIRKFADAVFVVPGPVMDEAVRVRVLLAILAGKPVFDSLQEICRWRKSEPYVCVGMANMSYEEIVALARSIRPIKIAFVAGKYFVGEKKGEVLVPDRNAIHENIIEANRVAVMLCQEEIGAFTPHNNTHHFELKARVGEAVYQEFDRLVLQRLVQGVVVLKSWVHSSGARREVALAQDLNLPVMYEHDFPSIRHWRDGKGPINIVHTVALENKKEEAP